MDWLGFALKGDQGVKPKEYWSVGVLECWFESGNRSDFYSLTFGYERSKHGSYFSIISTIHQYITPILQARLTSSFEKERMTAVYRQQ
jgi:hypothetical protein